MFNYILRKTIYKDEPPEQQNISLKLYSGEEFTSFLTYIILFFSEILLLLIPFCVFILSLKTIKSLILGGIFSFVLCISLILVCLIFHHNLNIYLNKLFYKLFFQLYWNLYTKKGQAISNDDFVLLKRNSPSLYKDIKKHYCKGFCVYFSYNILITLKKGQIYFVALKSVYPKETHNYYFIHTLYVNNGWCFDTDSVRQYKLEDFLNICNGKIYKVFSFADIQNFSSFDDFVDKITKSLQEWCKENDCSMWRSI